jgi:hypothetical protein
MDGIFMVAFGMDGAFGEAIAAVETATLATANDASTISTNAILNILIPLPPQYPLWELPTSNPSQQLI